VSREYAKAVIYKIADAVAGGEVVPIETAHISGVSYLTIGEIGIEFLEYLASGGAKVSVFTTANPAAVDIHGFLELDDRTKQGQRRVIKALVELGVNTTFTCAPYEFVLTRARTFHAWAESNAITYINTFRDAWSDKNPGPLALLSAIAGFVPKTQLYTLEGRRPTVLVKADLDSLDTLEAGVVGALIGEMIGTSIPYVKGIRLVHESSRREFAAALSTYSSIVFAVLEKITPNWEEYLRHADITDKIQISELDIKKYLRDVKTPDIIYLGCPFSDIETLMWVINEVKKRGPAKRPIYISTSPGVYSSLGGLVEEARRYNVVIFSGSCLVVSPHTKKYRIIATDSLKAIYYIPRMHGVDVVPCKKTQCIELAYA
jgi:predicted aconitase